MKVDPPADQVFFLSLFERKFVPVEKGRADKVLALTAFIQKPPAKGDEVSFDYPLREKVYRFEAAVASRGKLTLPAWPENALTCCRVDGLVTGWGDDKKTTVYAYVGAEGELAGKVLKLSFKFTDWPRVTLTLSGVE